MANYAIAISTVPEPVRSLAFGAISGTYAGIGTSITNPARIVLIQNFTDAALMISQNGVNDHYPINANSSILLDVSSNQAQGQGGFVAAGTRFYAKQVSAAATSGSIYLTVFYGYNG